MKRKYLWWVLVGLLVLFTAASCKSKPPAQEGASPLVETPAPTDTSPDQASLDALNRAIARADAARKLIVDFEGPFFFPEDWQSAESLYTQAVQQKNTSTRQAVQDSTSRYDRAANAFEAMTDKTFDAAYLYADRELTAARNAAIAAGAQALIPEYLLEIDNTVVSALDKYDAKDYYGAKDTAFKAYYMYDSMTTGLSAYNVREEITGRGFEVYDPQNFVQADDILVMGVYDYFDSNYAMAKDKAEEALFRYKLALKIGWDSFTAEKGADAATERQRALDLRANVASRQEFNSAQSVYTRATTAFRDNRLDEASSLYIESASLFSEVSRLTIQKRQEAERALNLANQRIMESDEKARSAEVILEGGF